MRNNGFMLFDVETVINDASGRPEGVEITNWAIGSAKGFSNLGTQTKAAAGIPFTAITDKIKIHTTKYRMQRNLLARDAQNEWRLWAVLKPEDVVPKNPNLVNLVLQEQTNPSIFESALEFYNDNKDGIL